VLWTVAAATAACALGGCATEESDRRPVEIVGPIYLTAPDIVKFAVESCNGAPEITELVQNATHVQIEVTSTVTNPGDACLDSMTLTLDQPLEGREIIDLTLGRPVPISEDPTA
jgi:hypothetical protein